MMDRLPGVTVLIYCRMRESSLPQAVDSVLGQDAGNPEVLLIHDSGHGAPSDLFENLGARLDDPRIRLVEIPSGGNTAAALNAGIGVSRADWLLWLDAKDSLDTGMIGKCLEYAQEAASPAILYPDLMGAGGEALRPSPEYDFGSLKRRDDIPYCAMFRKRAWSDVGGFRTNVEGDEAWDFWIACGSRGFTGKRIAEPLVRSARMASRILSDGGGRPEARVAQIRVNNRECYSHEETQAAEQLLGQSTGGGSGPSFHPARIPMVSVVIPTYNRTGTLKIALESVQAQTFRDFEIVVVSDCGSNELEGLIRDMNIRQNITYIRHGTNRGLGASRNTGLGAARGKYIAYLDDDDFFYPDHLETLIGFLERTGEKVAYTDAHRVWQHKVDGAYVEYKRDAPYQMDFDYDQILISNFVPVLCFIHARECLRETGVFDESLSTHEDWDLWIRMSRKYRMHRIPKFTSAFTHREDGTSMSVRRKRSFLDTTVAIYAKYPEAVQGRPELRLSQRSRVAHMQSTYGIEPSVPPPVPLLPGHARALEMLKAGDVEGAIRLLEDVATQAGTDARPYNDLGVLLVRAGRMGAAENHFRKAIELDPRMHTALRNLGDLRRLQGRHKEALDLYRSSLELEPGDPETAFSLGELSAFLGQAEVAKGFYALTLELHPGHSLARLRMASMGTMVPAPRDHRGGHG